MHAIFESIELLNEAIRQHRSNYDLTRTELEVLDVIAQYSCVDPGISYLRKSKIAEAIGKSRRTVVRVCNRLESLGIIRQYQRMRETGDHRQTSNRIEIQLATMNDVVRSDTPECHTKESLFINSKNIIINNTYANAPSSPYERFLSMANYFVDDRKLTNRLYGIWKAHTSYLRNAFDHEALLEAGLQAIKTTFQASKRKALRSITAYYNGTLDGMLDRLYYESVYEVPETLQIT